MFNYNPDTHLITREEGGEAIGSFNPETGLINLTVELANVHKGKLKAGLIEAGLEVKGFGKGDEGPGAPPPTAASDAPPCPPFDPRYGDKTPEVVDWYRQHQPDEYVTRYTNRRTHLSK